MFHLKEIIGIHFKTNENELQKNLISVQFITSNLSIGSEFFHLNYDDIELWSSKTLVMFNEYIST